MKQQNQKEKAFFALVAGGLWEKDVELREYGTRDFDEIMRLAEEQSVVGLVTAGLEHVTDVKVPKEWTLQFIGQSLQLEQQNAAMNQFIADLVKKMRAADIYALLSKGQGVAQCYERPLWRACGDVDFFLSGDNFQKAKRLLTPMASFVDQERGTHLGMTIDGWVVELHSSLRCGLSSRIDRVMYEILRDTFYSGNVRLWMNGHTHVFMLSAENDILFVFTHYLKHFYKEGLGLRQICDWCRLLWMYRSSMNFGLIESRIKKMGLMSEWKAFGAFAVEYLGMPIEAVPFLKNDDSINIKRKAEKIKTFILKVGNMGHNRDMIHYSKYPFLVRKAYSMGRRVGDLMNHARMFPLDSLRFFPKMMWDGVLFAIKGKG